MKLSFPVRIYILALVLRLIPVMLTRGLGIGLDDMFQYDMLARSLASGNGYRWYAQSDLERLSEYVHFDLSTATGYDPRYGLYTSFRAPLYPAFLAVVYFFSGLGFSRFFFARMVQAALLGAPLAPLTYYAARHLCFGIEEESRERIARISAYVVACYPMLIVYPLGLSTENLFFLLLLLSFIFLLRSVERPTVLNFLLVGMLLALTTLTRSVILLFAGLVIFFLLFVEWKRTKRFFLRNGGVVAGLVFVLIVAPWVIRNSLLHHKLTGIETSMGYNLYLGYHPQGNGSFVFGPSLDLLAIVDDAKRDEVGVQKAIGFIVDWPERIIPLVVNRLGFFFGLEDRALIYFYSNNLLGYIPAPVLIILGIFLLLPFVFVSASAVPGLSLLKWNLQIYFLILLLVSYLLPHVLILSEDRFHLALIPFLAILAAGFWVHGIQAIANQWRESFAGKSRVLSVILGVLLLFINWGVELSLNASKIAALLSPGGNLLYFPY
jgi:hypothetical protein